MNPYWFFYILIATIVSFAITGLSMPILLRLCHRRGIYDIPNERKIHHNNIPRLGGVLFIPSMLIGVASTVLLLIANGRENLFTELTIYPLLIVSGMFLIYLIGLFDDLFGMQATAKFVIQFIVSSIMPFCGLCINNLYGLFGINELPLWLAYGLTVFISLLIVNSINLIDGIDGLASSLSLFAIIILGILFNRQNMHFFALYCFALVGSVAAFWLYNMFGNAQKSLKTFMGDTGSLTLGYALAFITIRYLMLGGTQDFLYEKSFSFLIPFTLLIVPNFDLVRVATMRILRGKPMFHPDKTHIHHKCMRAGFSMHTSLCVILLLQLFFCFINWILVKNEVEISLIVIFDIIIFIAFNLCLNLLIRKKDKARIS